MVKAVILKPIVWNVNNYKKPSGSLKNYKRFRGDKKGSYPTYHGYGHEEWNNNDKRSWHGYKVFHTERTDRLLEYSKNGDLAIMMIASNKGNQYAVGIACNVYDNNDKEMNLISSDLNLYDNWKEVWKLNSVKFCFKENQQIFLQEWQKDYKWISWKCPPEYFHWFDQPIALNPKIFSNEKNRLTTMYGRWQGVRREDILSAINGYISKNHKIREWLTSGEFDNSILPKDMKVKSLKSSNFLQKRYGCPGSNRPTDKSYKYWIEGNILVEPLHAPLQEKFVDFLKEEKSLVIAQNQDYIDVQYKRDNNVVFAEVKPTKNIEPKYAIRIALGQLLEYQFKHNKSAILEIVISNKPKDFEVNFLKHLGVILTYYDEDSDKFIRYEL